MAKRSLASLGADDLRGKRVLVRVDFNVPLDDAGAITDDTRIRAALPTIAHLRGHGAKVILAAHFGRPKGQVNEGMRLTAVAARLSDLLGVPVAKTDSCIGPDAEAKVAALEEGGVVLLENVRFFAEEEKNDPAFAEKLASLADVYVNDAFGAAHRAHASTEGVTKFLRPSVAGFLMEKELQYLQGAIDEPKRPLAAIVGGSKVSSKIGVLEALIDKCDKILVGGGMIFTFYKARGLAVGKSLVEELHWVRSRSSSPCLRCLQSRNHLSYLARWLLFLRQRHLVLRRRLPQRVSTHETDKKRRNNFRAVDFLCLHGIHPGCDYHLRSSTVPCSGSYGRIRKAPIRKA